MTEIESTGAYIAQITIGCYIRTSNKINNMNFEPGKQQGLAGAAVEDTHGHILAGEHSEWEYPMRRSMQEIVPNVFLGPYACAMKKQFDLLKQTGITHIICVRQEEEARFVKPNFENDFKYLVVNISDDSSENIIKHFPEVCAFLDSALSEGGRILMHGNAGISRSGALLIAYIMQRHNLSYTEALRLVQLRRFCVSPNEGFQAQLMEYEPIYRAHKMVTENGNGTGGRKRGFVDDQDEESFSTNTLRNPSQYPEPEHREPLPGHGAYTSNDTGMEE